VQLLRALYSAIQKTSKYFSDADKDLARACLYYIAVGYFVMKNYKSTREYGKILLDVTPNHQNCKALLALVDEMEGIASASPQEPTSVSANTVKKKGLFSLITKKEKKEELKKDTKKDTKKEEDREKKYKEDKQVQKEKPDEYQDKVKDHTQDDAKLKTKRENDTIKTDEYGSVKDQSKEGNGDISAGHENEGEEITRNGVNKNKKEGEESSGNDEQGIDEEKEDSS